MQRVLQRVVMSRPQVGGMLRPRSHSGLYTGHSGAAAAANTTLINSLMMNSQQQKRYTSSSASAPISLSPKTIEVVKATAPVVGANALKIVEDFYPRMFRNNPETLAFFNKANQMKGAQQETLAGAVVAYATNIEDLAPVVPALPRIVHKHIALDVQAEHYGIVATNLMASIGHVLGDAVTPEIAAAWQEAIGFLAQLLIGMENDLRKVVEARSNGWSGYRPFRLVNKTMMADDCCKFRFEPTDDRAGVPFEFEPAQYLSVRVPLKEGEDHIAPRHYTIVSKSGEPFLECCVKRLEGGEVSTRLHQMAEGTAVTLAPPVGFDLIPRPGPAVVIGAGIGITPVVSLTKALPQEQLKAIIQVDRKADNAPFHQLFTEKVDKSIYHFVSATATGASGVASTIAAVLKSCGPIDTKTQYYICGPGGFMDSVEAALLSHGAQAANIHTERFGPRAGPSKQELKCPFSKK